MSYDSIDNLQLALAADVFSYASDRKKAAGRALGTLVEIITYYSLRTWGFAENVVIERRVPEYANPAVTHNVEFSLHPVRSSRELDVSKMSLPITGTKMGRALPNGFLRRPKQVDVLSKNGVKRNAAILDETDDQLVMADVDVSRETAIICELGKQPFAITECKRVGVEQGMKKGPQTIEKAKQGAYVARTVSSLQKMRLRNGAFYGFVECDDGSFKTGPYSDVLRQLINENPAKRNVGFMLTIGVVSNHGNWFTSDNPNKELQVLAQSYDWLIFLTDSGLTAFIDGLLLNPSSELEAIGHAFRTSYTGARGVNRFTKVRIDTRADTLLRTWFQANRQRVEGWFNVISPKGMPLSNLITDLNTLATG